MKRSKRAPALEWLCDMSGRAARITAVGSGLMLVENHRGILEFSPERIQLDTGCGRLQVEGSDLFLEQVRPDALMIRGELRCVLLPCGRKAPHES